MEDKIGLVREAEKLIKKDNYNEALGKLSRCLQFYPNFVTAKVLQSQCFFGLGEYDKALSIVNDVLSGAPDNIKARKIAVECNIELGNIDEAKSHIDFLKFLLPQNDPYIDNVNKKLDELYNAKSDDIDTDNDEDLIIETNSVYDEQVGEFDNSNLEQHEQLNPKNNIDNQEEQNDVLLGEQEDSEVLLDVNDISDSKDNADNVDENENVNYADNIDNADNVEEIETSNLVTGVLPEQVSTVRLPEKKEEPEIKTRTLALIYERQGMLKEALEILENLFNENNDTDILKDIDRIKTKLKYDDKGNFVLKKIKLLEDYLERIRWHSSN